MKKNALIVTAIVIVLLLTGIFIIKTWRSTSSDKATSQGKNTQPKVSISSTKWTQVNGPYGGYITDLEKSGASLIAATSYTYELGSNGVYNFDTNKSAWKALGGTDKAIEDISVDPKNKNEILFIAKGLYITQDGGKAWRKIDLKVDQYKAVAVSPANSSVIFAGTMNAGKAEIFASNDDGKNWQRSSILPNVAWSIKPIWAGFPDEARNWIQVIVPHPKDENTLFVGTNAALFKSTDKGKSWKRVDSTFHRTDILDIKINPKQPNEVYVRVGVFEEETCMQLAEKREQASAMQEEKQKCAGVYKSSDSGTTWQQMDSHYFDPSEGGVFIDEHNPANAYTIFSRMIEKTNNSGKSWDKFFWTHDDPSILDVGLERLVIGQNSDELFIAGRQGLLHSQDSGRHWQEKNKGFIGSEVVDIVKTNDGTIYAGTYSLGMFKSTDEGQNWSFASYKLENPYVMLMAKHPAKSKTIFLTTNGGVYVSHDGAKNWETVAPKFFFGKSGILPGVAHFHGIAIDPKEPKRMYVGGGGDQYSPDGAGMSISEDGGKTWKEINNGFETDVHVSKIVIDKKNPSIIYATTQGATEFSSKTGNGHGIFKSTNYGQKWTKINSGLETVEHNTFSIDPNNSQVLYVGTDDNGIYKSIDGGVSWQPLSIPKLPKNYGVGDIVINPKDSNSIYVATVDYFRLSFDRGFVGDHGVYASKDGGKTWNDYNQGLEHKGAFSLELDEQKEILYVGTRGGGIYWRKIN